MQNLYNPTQSAQFNWASVFSACLKKPLVCGLICGDSHWFRLRSSPVDTAVYPERCQSRRLTTFLRQSPQGTGRHKSLVRTRCCLLSMLTSQTPRGSFTAARGSFSNPSSLSSQVSRCAKFPPWELWQRKYSEGMWRGNTLNLWMFSFFFFCCCWWVQTLFLPRCNPRSVRRRDPQSGSN